MLPGTFRFFDFAVEFKQQMQLIKDNNLLEPSGNFFLIRSARCALPIWPASVLAVVVLIAAGLAYRVVASVTANTAISLPVALSNFPVEIGNWTGTEMEIPTTTREYMTKNFADDYISRRYFNSLTQNWADLYIVYCASRPGGMLGHQPQVCYPGNGWIADGTEKAKFTILQGRQINCLIHRFHKPAAAYDQTIVLNFFVVNGRLVTSQSSFSGILHRGFNLARNPARYAAQVQISSASESSVMALAKDVTERILELLPDENGKIAAVERF
jgi:EpsI family protein